MARDAPMRPICLPVAKVIADMGLAALDSGDRGSAWGCYEHLTSLLTRRGVRIDADGSDIVRDTLSFVANGL